MAAPASVGDLACTTVLVACRRRVINHIARVANVIPSKGKNWLNNSSRCCFVNLTQEKLFGVNELSKGDWAAGPYNHPPLSPSPLLTPTDWPSRSSICCFFVECMFAVRLYIRPEP